AINFWQIAKDIPKTGANNAGKARNTNPSFTTLGPTMRLHPLFQAILAIQTAKVFSSDDEERLMMDVFRGYNYLIQPVKNISDTPIIVKIALQLVLLINV
ncbi:hypothetical protein ANCDUO_20593, partial [Ancylostoma duodenale]